MATAIACPKCSQPLIRGAKFCAQCGNDVSAIWGDDPVLGSTLVEIDPRADDLTGLLTAATIGEYDIYGELGRGGMAAVYLGLDLALNRKVAIKTMLPDLTVREDMVARFKREAQTAAGLNHPHIIQIHSVKEVDGLVFFIMRFVEGRSLESVIHETGHVSLEMAHTILSQVGSALDYAHRRHVIHRDVKPANIMIDENGMAIVTDFGIAKVQEAQNLTATGAAMGTPHYMSPEHIHNEDVTGKSDQYSMGVVLFEMLTGKPPFDGRTYAELITQHLFEEPPDVREVNAATPEAVALVIKRMLAKDPKDRFEDLDEAAQALGEPLTRQQLDLTRTAMMTLAKSGPQKKLRVSVPMSPVPMTKKPSTPKPAGRGGQKGTSVKPTPPKRRSAARWLIPTLLIVAGAGSGGWYLMQSRFASLMSPSDSAAVQLQGDSTVPARADSQIVTAAPDSAAEAEIQRLRQDSIRTADNQKRLQRQADSLKRVDKLRADSVAAKQRADSIARHVRDSLATVQRIKDSIRTDSVRRAETADATVLIGTRTPQATLLVDGVARGDLSTARPVKVRPNQQVKLTIAAPNCTAWDTVIFARAGAVDTIGRRQLRCQTP